jgi:outer membrane protein assembly factor BamD (BamD/ComL family)
MIARPTFPALLALLLLAGLSACSKQKDVQSELEKASAAFGAAEPAPATPPPTPPPAYPQPNGNVQVQPVAAPPPPPAQQLNQAMAAYQAQNYEDAVTKLQRLRSTPAMTPQQAMALQDAMAAVMTEIYARAERGDARAIQAVKQYELMQTGRGR